MKEPGVSKDAPEIQDNTSVYEDEVIREQNSEIVDENLEYELLFVQEPESNETEEIVEILEDIIQSPQRDRIAILVKNFVEAIEVSPSSYSKCLKTWKKGQIVFNEDDVERLLNSGAPIKVFIEDVDRCPKR